MKQTYKPGDEIKISQFTKKQVDVIDKQIKIINAAHTGLDHFSYRLSESRKILMKLVHQCMPVLKDYAFHIEHDTKTIKIVIDNRILK